jgi:hypothetical protein
MNRLFIWWHRRRAAYHFAEAANNPHWNTVGWYHTWGAWHLERAKILSAPERKLPAPPKAIGLEGSGPARD